MRLATVEAAMTNSRPITTWLAARGLSCFHCPIMGHEEPIYITPKPDKPQEGGHRGDELRNGLRFGKPLFERLTERHGKILHNWIRRIGCQARGGSRVW